MICIYPADCTDFSNNGLGLLSPQSCTVTETLNGEYELTLVHPMDAAGKWLRIAEGCIIRAPVPAAATPRIGQVIQDYNTDTYDRIRSGSIKAKSAITAFRFVVGDDSGFFVLGAGTAFDVSKPILWATGNAAANTTTTNVYVSYGSINVRYQVSDFTGSQGASLYLVGTLNGKIFTPANVYLKGAVPTEEDGLTYILLGTLSSSYYLILYPEHPMFRFADGKFQPLTEVGYQAYLDVGTLRVETQTAIEQTQQSIALKADKTVTDALGQRVEAAEASLTTQAEEIEAITTRTDDLEGRMDSAELKLQPNQIVSAVRSSTLYQSDLYHARNYALNSHLECKFVGSKYHNGTSQTSTSTISYSVSDELFEHSNEGASLRLSVDILRSSVDAASASAVNVYSGLFIYFTYLNDSGQETVSGLGYYLRTTDSDFHATDDTWVRLTKGPIDLSQYNPISIDYVGIGVANASGSTGTVQFRNLKVEVSNGFTAWSAAPEDLSEVQDRLTTAESTITQHSNQIALKVSTSAYNANRVYRSSTAPTSPSTNMLWLDTSTSPNLLKRYTGSTWVAAGAQEVKSSGLYIGPNNVSIRTENFLLQLLDPANNENVLMEMSADGNVGFKELYADSIVSKSVVSAYNGPAYMYVDPTYTGTDEHYRQDIASNAVVADCIGGVKGYAWTNGGDPILALIGKEGAVPNSYGSNGCPDKGANGMFTYAKGKGCAWGAIDTLPEVVGLALHKDGHIGYYMGNGYAVEWQGFSAGCVRTKVANRSWQYWYKLPFLDYGDGVITGNTPTIDVAVGTRLLEKGASGADVKAMQEMLIQIGYDLPHYGADGKFGRETLSALLAFQRDEGLEDDGKYGEKTHAALLDAVVDDDEDGTTTDAGAGQTDASAQKPAEEDEKKASSTKVVIISEGGKVNIRVGNGTEFSRISSVAPGTTFNHVATAANGWHAIVVGSRVGWVSGNYARII